MHRPIVPIFHPDRPVPLSYAIADLAGDIHDLAAVRSGRARVVGDESRAQDDRGRWYSRRVVDPTVLIEALEARRWLPTLYFIFSRVGCERAMDDVLTEGGALRHPRAAARGRRRDQRGAGGDAVDRRVALNQTHLPRGCAWGWGSTTRASCPRMKRLIEVLFERGLCRVVFATETMALGIHMPARSVVLQGLTKRTERGFRTLLTTSSRRWPAAPAGAASTPKGSA